MKAFKDAWISYKSQRIEQSKIHTNQVKDKSKVGIFSIFDLLELEASIEKAFSAITSDSRRFERISSKLAKYLHLSWEEINKALDNACNNEYISFNLNGMLLKQTNSLTHSQIKQNIEIVLPIKLITTRNFSIQKNLSISA